MKQLDRLLLEQGHQCFFCGDAVSRDEASVEHLWAVATGGTNEDQNVVACCKSINSFFASRPLKEKIGILLRQNGRIRCPAETEQSTVAKVEPPVAPPPAPVPVLVPAAAPAQKVQQNGPIFTLADTSKAAKQEPKAQLQQFSPPAAKPHIQVPAKSTVRCPTCHTAVPKAVGQIDYVCPQCRGAFRY